MANLDMNTLLAAMNQSATPATSPAGKKGTPPIGGMDIKFGEFTLASRSIWEDETSKDPFSIDFNKLCKEQPDVIKQLAAKMLESCTIEIWMKGSKSSGLDMKTLLSKLI